MTDTATSPAVGPSGSPPTAPAPAPRRRGFLFRLLRVLVVLLLLIGLSPLALRLPFVRSFVASRAGKALGADVEIGSVSAWWTSGIDLEGLVVKSPAGFDGPFATVEHLHVDVSLWRLLRGDVQADVRVTKPVLSLRRRADGTWNHAEVLRERAPSEGKPDSRGGASGPGPVVHVKVVEGSVEAHGLGRGVERISHIDFQADLAADGALVGTLAALAEQAGAKGGDVRLRLSGGRAPGTEQPLEAEIPELNLERLAGLIEGFTGLRDLHGTARLDAKGAFTAGGSLEGRLTLGGQGFEARTAGGARVVLGSVSGTVDVTQGPEGDTADAALTLERVEITDGEGAQARTLSEPTVSAAFRAQRAPDDTIRVPRLELSAGQALRLTVPAPLEVSAAGSHGRRVAGKAELTADLGRLAALKTFVPALASLRSGVLSAAFDGRAAEGLDVGLGARLSNLVLDAGELAPDGYEERDATVTARLSQAADGTTSVQVITLTSALARLAGAQPFSAQRAPSGALTFSGPLDLSVDLAALSRLLGGALGLSKGERLAGTLALRGSASGTPDDGRLQAMLGGRDLVLPASWSRARSPSALEGALTLSWTKSALLLEVKGLKALGLTADLATAMKRDAQSMAFDGADLTLTADLAEVRERLGPRLGLAPASTLTGQLQSTLRLVSTREGRRLEGSTRLSALSYRATPDGAPLDEPALTLEHTLVMPRDESPLRLEVARARGNGYVLDLSGSSFSAGAARRVDLRGALEGEAARLAERARAFLGPDFRDLTGTGKVTGRVAFASAGPDLLAAGTADADLSVGTWSAAGASLGDGRLTARRPGGQGAYQVALTGTLNQGSASTTLALQPSGTALGWRLVAALKGVDLSTVLVNQGAGQYLAYVLPTLVPGDKSTPVLSGRLDADLDLSAGDLAGEALLGSLAGKGNVALTQGTLGESTLFSAIGGGSGLGDAGKALLQVAPEVGQELANLQHTLAFQSLTSRFEVGGRRLTVKESHLTGSALRLDLTGTVTFEKQVDLAARLWIGSRAGEQLKSVVPDQTIPLKITRSLDKPRVVPDLDAAKLLKAALPGLLPTGGESPEDLKRRLEDELKRRFKNPFK